MEALTKSLVFIGFMGAGKTSAARAAAAALGTRAVDSDHVLEERLGSGIEAYFESHGERAFREIEQEVVGELLDAPPSPVISLGGGAIQSDRVREALARHTVVLLDRMVGVHRAHAVLGRDGAGRRGLAGAHEADEDERAQAPRRFQPIRSS